MAYERRDVRELMRSKRQVGMVMDLNKCIGCQSCSVACKTLWTDQPGMENMWWNNVATQPAKGYPKNWRHLGGGYDENGKMVKGELPELEEYGRAWEFNFNEVQMSGQGFEKALRPLGAEPRWGPNWEEDQGGGEWPNAYYFYLPRICNHCTRPSCVDACPRQALYKREEDGIVVLDQERCNGYRLCMEACPYKKIYWNHLTKTGQKCIFCYPRIEHGIAPACARQCPGRLRFLGYLDDEDGPVYKLARKWKVALPLLPQSGCDANVFYVPPLSPPRIDANGEEIAGESRIPVELLRELFGHEVERALKTLEAEMAKTRRGERSELMDILIARNWHTMFQLGREMQVIPDEVGMTVPPSSARGVR
ncbi:MAG: 4Fe-4S dicluster domain-containing protein [Candidatus Binatia bacterium]